MKKTAKPDKLIALTVKIDQRTYERLCVLRARTRETASDICKNALLRALRDAGV